MDKLINMENAKKKMSENENKLFAKNFHKSPNLVTLATAKRASRLP